MEENMKEEKNTVDERVQFLESLNKLVEMGKKKGVETPCFKEAWERARGIRR